MVLLLCRQVSEETVKGGKSHDVWTTCGQERQQRGQGMPKHQEFQKAEVFIICPQQTEHRKFLACGVSEEHVKPVYAEVGHSRERKLVGRHLDTKQAVRKVRNSSSAGRWC